MVIKEKFDQLTEDISNPDIIADTKLWQSKVKEHSSLQALMEEFVSYLKMKSDYDGAQELLEIETDLEMREMLKDEIQTLKEGLSKSEDNLKILMLPKVEVIIKILRKIHLCDRNEI